MYIGSVYLGYWSHRTVLFTWYKRYEPMHKRNVNKQFGSQVA